MDKPKARMVKIDAEIDAALERAKRHRDDFISAKTVEHDERLNILIVTAGSELVVGDLPADAHDLSHRILE